ncbi:fungal chitosanase of glycosyl hydrolase group 75-domain-containing protein [Clohesyomyces aquaticus]|uniref:Endo-chitosanase n=1 Tax=Clohesyomyces aquaticus TaxID=1231657 RepID=A0A1Y1ZI50_9PLEO|nr:fungal chitosanase of glycosyl hydrolase group 75-domain-containing protein [Clohesyomyces aquaticus]
MRPSISLVLLLVSLIAGQNIPTNVKAFYDSHIKGACPNPLSIRYSSGQDKVDTVYCQHKASSAKFGIKDLDAHIHTYVATAVNHSAGIKSLSVVAVVCGDSMFYGVWGDLNGVNVTGEVTLSLEKLYFPNKEINGNKGHTHHDVLYIAFPGDDAGVGAEADWKVSTAKDFEKSL